MPRAAKAASRRPSQAWWPEAVEVPRPQAPDAAALARRQRWYRRLVWACLVTTPVAMVALIGSLANAGGKPAPPPAPAASSPGKLAATMEVEEWLAATPPPLPGGRLLSWDGARDLPPISRSRSASVLLGQKSGAAAPTIELDSFSLMAHGQPYQATVEVALTPSGPVALAGPSLMPVSLPGAQAASELAQSGPWPGLSAGEQVSSQVSQAISGWLDAFVSGSPSQLALAVGDPNPADHYTPLRGVSSATYSVVDSAALDRSGSTEAVEVTLQLTWSGEAGSDQSATPQGPQTTLDLLVERANSAAPVVVAWGPPGSGPHLRPYQNGHA